jgi:O-6-methylguanine DNA methyltransferase
MNNTNIKGRNTIQYDANVNTQEALASLNIQFGEYISGKRKKFDLRKMGIHADLRELKGTELQKKVWGQLSNIPYGKTLTYSELAQRVGKPKAVRAVASAVASNPLCIIIPCHRVLPKQSKGTRAIDIGQYVLGKELKEILLKLEGVPGMR